MKSIAEIKAIRDKMQADKASRETGTEGDIRIVVGMATCGIAAGARPVFNTLVDEVASRQLTNVKVTRTGCMGMCKLEPLVEVYIPGQEKVTISKRRQSERNYRETHETAKFAPTTLSPTNRRELSLRVTY